MQQDSIQQKFSFFNKYKKPAKNEINYHYIYSLSIVAPILFLIGSLVTLSINVKSESPKQQDSSITTPSVKEDVIAKNIEIFEYLIKINSDKNSIEKRFSDYKVEFKPNTKLIGNMAKDKTYITFNLSPNFRTIGFHEMSLEHASVLKQSLEAYGNNYKISTLLDKKTVSLILIENKPFNIIPLPPARPVDDYSKIIIKEKEKNIENLEGELSSIKLEEIKKLVDNKRNKLLGD